VNHKHYLTSSLFSSTSGTSYFISQLSLPRSAHKTNMHH